MNFIVMKRFGEVDPARAFAKLTHARIETLPIAKLDDVEDTAVAREIATLVRLLLTEDNLSREVDQKIELLLRRL